MSGGPAVGRHARRERIGRRGRVAVRVDVRSGILHATGHGLAQMTATRTARLQRVDRLFADWPESERRRFAALLARLNQSLAATLIDEME